MAPAGTQLDMALDSTASEDPVYVLDPRSGELRGGGLGVRLGPRPAQVLAYLAGRPGELVTRDDLLTHVWQGAAVTDDAVWKAIANLRKSLADPRDRPRFVETLPRRGYRLIAQVHLACTSHQPSAATPHAPESAVLEADSARQQTASLAASQNAASALHLQAPPASRDEPGEKSGLAGTETGSTAVAAIEEAGHRSRRFHHRPRRHLAGLVLVAFSSVALISWAFDMPWSLPETRSLASPTMVSPTMVSPTMASPSPRQQEAVRLVAVADEFLKRADRSSLQHATRLYERAIEVDRSHAPGFSGLANARALEAMRFAGKREHLELATEDAQRAIALDPALSSAHIALGIAAVGLDQTDVALEAFATALHVDPDNPRARLNMSLIERLGGRPDLAIERVQSLEPDTPERWAIHNLHLARCYFLLGDLSSSFDLLHQALEMVPADPGVTLEWARQEWLSDRPEAAMQILEPLLHEPQPPVRHLAGLIALSEGRWGEGLRWFETLTNPEAKLYAAFARSQLARMSPPPTAEPPLDVDPSAPFDRPPHALGRGWQSRWLAARLAWLEGDVEQGWHWLDQAIGHGFLDGLLVAADPIVRAADASGKRLPQHLAKIDRRRSELLLRMSR